MRQVTIAHFSKTFLTTLAAPGLLLLWLAMCGCGPAGAGAPELKPPHVLVSKPVRDVVTDYEDFTGETRAVKSIDVRARVTGYLEKVRFTEGAEVKEGEKLFEIDPRTYQADYDRALANVGLAKAHLERVTADFKRAQELLPMKAISKSDFDLAKGDHDEGAASVAVAEAALHTAKLNLDWCVVTAPISGRISRQRIDPGNLVQADNTILTTIVSLDPMYAYFYVDERSMLRFRRLLRAGKIKSAQEAQLPVLLGLSDEDGYPHEGTINFVDNALDQMTGTLQIRGRFPNPANPNRLLSPGMFARVRVPIGDAHEALLVSERALGSDQGEKFVYVVGPHNNVAERRVKVGALRNGLRVIEDGISPGDRVVLSGLQQIHPGKPVDPEDVKMTAEEPLVAPASSVAAAPAAAPKTTADPAAATKPAPATKPAATTTKPAPATKSASVPLLARPAVQSGGTAGRAGHQAEPGRGTQRPR